MYYGNPQNPQLNKQKLMLILKVPPPVHGASLMNQYISESTSLAKRFTVRKITTHYSRDFKDTGRMTVYKLWQFMRNLVMLGHHLFNFQPHIVYFQISPFGLAFIRDSIYVFMIYFFQNSIVLHLHGKGLRSEMGSNKAKRRFYQIVFKNTEIICLSAELKRDIAGIYNGNPYVVPNGIPVGPQFVQNSNGQIQILYLSNLIKHKGIFDFIAVLSRVKAQNPHFRAVIIGNEDDVTATTLHKAIYESGLREHVSYVGPKYGDEKYLYLAESDIFLFPSYYRNEAFPLVILEAMQYRCGIIATREGAIPEILEHGKTGFLVEQRNISEMVNYLLLLLDEPEQIRYLAINAYKVFKKKFTLTVFETNLINAFEQILRKERST